MVPKAKNKAGSAVVYRDPLLKARKAIGKKRFDLAEKAALSILKTMPNSIDALEILATAKLEQGKTDEATTLLRQAVLIAPSSITARMSLGNLLIAGKQPTEAVSVFDSVLQIQPDHVLALVSRGVMLGMLGRSEEALQSYEKAISLDPNNHDALNNAGTLLGAQNRHEEAVNYYQRALASKPEYPEALNNLAVSLVALGRKEEAVDKYAVAFALRPDYADAIKNHAELLTGIGRNSEALASYDRVLKLMPDVAALHNNRGTVLSALNRHQEAMASYNEALRLKPDYAGALNNRGTTLSALNRFEEALQCFRDAEALEPDYVSAHWNESLALLRLGRLREGWEKHEWRWKKPEFDKHRYPFTQPRLEEGDNIAGKTIMVTCEQGYGDAMQFCRYVPMLEARGAKVILFVPEALVALFENSFPSAQVMSTVSVFPPFDFHSPILSLPRAFGTTLENMPDATPYLRAPDDLHNRWLEHIRDGREGLHVGIVWSGNATHKNDTNRSLSLASFAAIANLPGMHFYSLQKETSASDRETLKSLPQIQCLGDELENFAQTAAAIEALDLVISVDTSVAHLAGALGKPVWILLPYISDWRWLPGRTDSPWYPHAKLYWQPDIDQWAPTLQTVVRDLSQYRPPGPPARRTAVTKPMSATSASTPQVMTLVDALNQALALHRNGNLADAESICVSALQLQPQQFDALLLMGTLRVQLQRVDEAIDYYERAVAANPASVIALSNLSGALRLANRHEDALPFYDRAGALEPDNPSVPTNRAVSLMALKRHEEAMQNLQLALKIDPRYIAALNNRGVINNEWRRFDDALHDFDQALSIKPDFDDAYNNRGLSLVGMGRLDDADKNYADAIAINPKNSAAYCNRGLVLALLNRNQEAIDAFRNAQRLNPDYVDAFWNESLMTLVLGNFADGWRQYEWRWKKPEFAPAKREFHLPQWTGKEDIKGKTIFLYYEQGLGDTMQFVRYIDLLDAIGAKVILSALPALRKLLETSFPHVRVFSGDEVLPPFDFYSPLLSLPLAFGTLLDSVPNRSPYFRVPQDYLIDWQQRIPPSQKRKIGLVWSGNPKHRHDYIRSMPLGEMTGLLAFPGIEFFSLQKEVTPEDKAVMVSHGVTLLGHQFRDFTDTAAAIMQLDLVISVDTSVAHLAGALGKPVWIMLAFAPDWRWLLDREDSPWYPTARLFRQPRPGAWKESIQRVVDALPGFKPLPALMLPAPALSMEDAHKTALTLLRAGKVDDAEAVANALINMQPGWFDAQMLMGSVRLRRKQFEAAIPFLQEALRISPNSTTALFNLSNALRLAKRHDEAFPLFDRAIALDPENPDFHNIRGVAFLDKKRFDEAIDSFGRALAIAPRHLAALINRGATYYEDRQYTAALHDLDAAMSIDPDSIDGRNNRGLSLLGLDRIDDAMQDFLHVIALDNDNAPAHNNLGLALAALHRHQEAIGHFHKAQALQPDYVDAYWNESLIQLLLGNFSDGWRLHEWRWKKPEFKPHFRTFPWPLWNGREPIKGKTFFLHFEQGFGDTLQFVRYIDGLQNLGAKVFVSAPPSLHSLIENSFPGVAAYFDGDVVPPFDFHCPMLGMPLVMGTTLESIPSRNPYLTPPDESMAKWKRTVPTGQSLKIGLVWSGNPQHSNDRNRSLPLAALDQFLRTEGCQFYSLQREISDTDRALLRDNAVISLGDEFKDFSDTAAAIMQLDLVISVDTSVAHLAGALGKPLWLLLPFNPDWRWLLDRNDSPWYPTARLFRQASLQGISGLVAEVAKALQEKRYQEK